MLNDCLYFNPQTAKCSLFEIMKETNEVCVDKRGNCATKFKAVIDTPKMQCPAYEKNPDRVVIDA